MWGETTEHTEKGLHVGRETTEHTEHTEKALYVERRNHEILEILEKSAPRSTASVVQQERRSRIPPP